MDEILEIGTDISAKWEFKDGDLVLATHEDNILQSIRNRLNNHYGSLGLYYNEYGSFLQLFLGWRKTPDTLKFLKKEIINTLQQDPRLQNLTVDLAYADKGTVNGNIQIKFDDETDLSLSMILSNFGIELEEEDTEYGD